MYGGLKKQHSKGRLSQIARDLESNGAFDDGGNSLSPNSVRSMLNAFRKPLGLPLLEPEKKEQQDEQTVEPEEIGPTAAASANELGTGSNVSVTTAISVVQSTTLPTTTTTAPTETKTSLKLATSLTLTSLKETNNAELQPRIISGTISENNGASKWSCSTATTATEAEISENSQLAGSMTLTNLKEASHVEPQIGDLIASANNVTSQPSGTSSTAVATEMAETSTTSTGLTASLSFISLKEKNYTTPRILSYARTENTKTSTGRKALTTGVSMYNYHPKTNFNVNDRPIFNSSIQNENSVPTQLSSHDAHRKTLGYVIPQHPTPHHDKLGKGQPSTTTPAFVKYSADHDDKKNGVVLGDMRNENTTGETTFTKVSSMLRTPGTTKGVKSGSSSRTASTQKSAGNITTKKKQANYWKLTTEKVCETSYLVLKQLGKGGCGEVYLVMENESRNLHALKKINMQQLDNAGIQECINEVQMLLALRDTELVIHIVEWEVDHTNHVLKIVMEYGQCDLSKTIMFKGTTLTKLKSCWENMLLIVEAIHSKGIVHGDLKPANFVWVAGRLKIIDFGIANKLQTDVTSIQTCNPKGTLNFMSPESIRPDAYGRAKIGPKSDIWSLGCILYLMVYGYAPFQNYQNHIAKMNAIINGAIEYPPLPTHLDDMNILDILRLCFQLDSRNRPTASALLKHPFLST